MQETKALAMEFSICGIVMALEGVSNFGAF